MDLLNMLDVMGKKLEKTFPKVNCGGCAVVAAEVATALASRLNLCAHVRTSSAWMDEFDVFDIAEARQDILDPNNATADDWGGAGVHFGHVIVEFQYEGKWYHYDTSGVNPPRHRTHLWGYSIYPGHLTIDEARSIANSHRGWNTQFDRQQIPRLQKMISKHFDKIQNQLTSAAS